MDDERRNDKRRKFGYYMRVLDSSTSELLGYLSDISMHGIKMDSPTPFLVNKNYTLQLELTPDVSDRLFISFVAKVKWAQPDPIEPGTYIGGLNIITISPKDEKIYNRIFEMYGTPESSW
jgi:hypothetical protein